MNGIPGTNTTNGSLPRMVLHGPDGVRVVTERRPAPPIQIDHIADLKKLTDIHMPPRMDLGAITHAHDWFKSQVQTPENAAIILGDVINGNQLTPLQKAEVLTVGCVYLDQLWHDRESTQDSRMPSCSGFFDPWNFTFLRDQVRGLLAMEGVPFAVFGRPEGKDAIGRVSRTEAPSLEVENLNDVLASGLTLQVPVQNDGQLFDGSNPPPAIVNLAAIVNGSLQTADKRAMYQSVFVGDTQFRAFLFDKLLVNGLKLPSTELPIGELQEVITQNFKGHYSDVALDSNMPMREVAMLLAQGGFFVGDYVSADYLRIVREEYTKQLQNRIPHGFVQWGEYAAILTTMFPSRQVAYNQALQIFRNGEPDQMRAYPTGSNEQIRSLKSYYEHFMPVLRCIRYGTDIRNLERKVMDTQILADILSTQVAEVHNETDVEVPKPNLLGKLSLGLRRKQ